MGEKNYDKYQKNYSESEFWIKLKKVARKAGVKVVYAALLLYYVLRNPATPSADRAKILGALGYFILPIDLLPDFLPVAGFTDDLAALTWALLGSQECDPRGQDNGSPEAWRVDSGL